LVEDTTRLLSTNSKPGLQMHQPSEGWKTLFWPMQVQASEPGGDVLLEEHLKQDSLPLPLW
jgi:hypothetical protein